MTTETSNKPRKSRARAATIDVLVNQGGFASPFDTIHPNASPQLAGAATSGLKEDANSPNFEEFPETPKQEHPGIQPTFFTDDYTANNIILEIDPSCIRPWRYADRPEHEITGIDELAEDINHYGQSTPILVRRLSKNEGQISYEYIYGCRRLEACRRLGINIKAICYNSELLSDAHAYAMMFSENEQRQGISTWARSLSFEKILTSGVFKSKRELSLSIGKNEDYLKDITIYSRLPEQLKDAVGVFTNVSIGTAKILLTLSKDEIFLEKLINIAHEIRDGISPSSLKSRFRKQATTEHVKQQVLPLKNGKTLTISMTAKGFNIQVGDDIRKLLEPNEIALLLSKMIDKKGI